MQQNKINFIVNETTGMHNMVAEAYEALMDEETDVAIKVLNSIADKARELKADLLNKEN